MRKIVILILVLCVMLTFCGCAGCAAYNGCNKVSMFDGILYFDEAIIMLPNGEIISGACQAWNDYEGDQLQIKIDGVWYLVHSVNATLIARSK